MTIKGLREKGKSELIKLLKEARIELVKLNLDRRSGSLADGSVLGKKRREIAQILTVLGEKEILEIASATSKTQKGKETQKEEVKDTQGEQQHYEEKT